MRVASFEYLNSCTEDSTEAIESIVARARRGDAEAFRNIFEQHHRFIMRFVYGMVGERALAEELTQETFMRAYVSLRTLRDEDKLPTWLCGIARNVVRRFFRSGATHRRTETVEAAAGMFDDQRGAPDDHLLNKEINEAIRDALMQLDEDKRLIFTLKVLQGRSYEEIASITGSSIPKLKTDLHRAKRAMRGRLRDYHK